MVGERFGRLLVGIVVVVVILSFLLGSLPSTGVR
jgi:hypothetical protein